MITCGLTTGCLMVFTPNICHSLQISCPEINFTALSLAVFPVSPGKGAKSKVVSKIVSKCILSKYLTLNRGIGKEEEMAKILFQKHPLDYHGNFQNVKEGLP